VPKSRSSTFDAFDISQLAMRDRQPKRHRIVDTILAPAPRDIVASSIFSSRAGMSSRSVLQVTVERNDDGALASSNPAASAAVCQSYAAAVSLSRPVGFDQIGQQIEAAVRRASS